MAKPKVWSGMVMYGGEQLHAACSATSAKRVAELCNASCRGYYSAGAIRNFWSPDCGNAAIIEATAAHPDTLLLATVKYPTRADQWRPAEEKTDG